MSKQQTLKALNKALANFEIPDDVVKNLAEKLSKIPDIKRIDICKYGICIDKFSDKPKWWEELEYFNGIEGGHIRELKVFPWGIINPDLFQLKLELEFDELSSLLRNNTQIANFTP